VGWVLTARFVDRIGKGIRGAPRDALIADFTAPEIRGAAYGLRQSLDTVGAFLGPLLGQAMLSASITPNLFLAAAAGPAALCALVSLWVPAALAVRKQAEAPPVKA
jgi:MFS family permease